MEIFGIDVGGSGIKGAPVNIKTGELTADRHRIATPKPAKPEAIAKAVKKLLKHFDWTGPVGCGFPTVIVDGKSRTFSNIDPEWVGVQVDEVFHKKTGHDFKIINDADAAGIAEMTFGAGKGEKGLVMTITIGTGLGTGVFYDGVLVPNFELGRMLHTNGQPIEFFAADSARKKKDLSYKEWGSRFDVFLHHLVRIFSPDLFILGGGASKKLHKFQDMLTVEVPIKVAEKRNQAGIIGAALNARSLIK
jgi:polyphosphate glucokinase